MEEKNEAKCLIKLIFNYVYKMVATTSIRGIVGRTEILIIDIVGREHPVIGTRVLLSAILVCRFDIQRPRIVLPPGRTMQLRKLSRRIKYEVQCKMICDVGFTVTKKRNQF